MNGTTKVFVYETLLSGEPNHGLLAHAEFRGEARTEPAFELVKAMPGAGLAEKAQAYLTQHATS
jgi:gamma-glutamylcyclotransferase (GGCT)/AIG2-like uncharacterized protein YtfP